MKEKGQLIIVTIVLFATLFALSIGAQLKQDIATLTSMTQLSQENTSRAEMEDLLNVTRESIIQYTKSINFDASKQETIDEIIANCIKPLNVESVSGNVILMQVQPSVKMLYSKRPVTISDGFINLIKVGIDSNMQDDAIYDINNNNKLTEWVGVPPGIQTFNGNTKWVLIIQDDSLVSSNQSRNILGLQKNILYKLYIILFISCLVVITTVVTMYNMQKDKYYCEDKENCPYKKK